MPSSHSSFVTCLSMLVGFDRGFASTEFAMTAVFAIIVMYDASGVRRAVGKQATILNQILDDFHHKKHIEQIEAAQKQNQSLQEQLKTLNESQKKLQIIHQKQQEDLGKNLTKMQDANTLLQKSLEKATMQNAETLKELNHAKEQAKELEHSMSELKSKNGTNIWMWIAISAILILLCMLVL